MSTDENEHLYGTPQGQEQGRVPAQGGPEHAHGWQPLPSEGYDSDATAFVQLPPDFDFGAVPLEAPGHGYVPPPMIVPLTPAAANDPAATGTWAVHEPTEAEYLPPHESVEQQAASGVPEAQGGHDPHATGQWSFPDAAHSTGQWTIPTAPEGADESGEFTTSMLAQYASSAPATLPGGAPAPWAVPQEAESGEAQQTAREPEAAGEQAPEPAGEQASHDALHQAGHDAPHEPGHEPPHDEPAAGEPVAPATAAEEPHGTVPAAFAAPEVPEALPEPPEALPEPPPAPVFDTGSSSDSEDHPHVSYVLRVNGADRPVTGSWIGESLLYVLRERLGLAGAKDGCSQGECGACNVQVDGRLVASCLVPAATAAGSEVRTVEGLAVDGEPSDVQRALAACGAVQCGYCIPGMAMTVHDLLEGNPAPTEREARQALCGNLCRCSGYRGVLDAVQEVVAERSAAAANGQAAEPADEARIPQQIPHPLDGGMA
ncbi:2Fe-2S iron-sulfur cluster-binding protein [Streptomyces tritici]|uniref:2Fe-2S iron-sulfur cluster-binding protein n=1 Tax=Streptomyces tritici TaxID=2054410 RepID=UPI003AEF2BAE